MGQALQKLGGGSRAAKLGGASKAPVRQQAIDPVQPSATVRHSVEVKPQAPEPQRIIEPEPIQGEWDRGDPKYSAMMQQVVGKITTRPAGGQEMGSAHVTAEFRRLKPANRHTSAATGPDEEKVVAAGTLNIAGIHEALRLYQGLGEGQEQKSVDVKALAERFNVDVVLLERVFKYTSLPVPQQPDSSKKLRT